MKAGGKGKPARPEPLGSVQLKDADRLGADASIEGSPVYSPPGKSAPRRIPAYAGYLFDLDGTLIDTAPDLTRALNHALAAFGHAPVQLAQARNWVGQGAKASLLRALAHQGAPADDLDAMLASFLDYYRLHIADLSAPFPGVEEALQALAERGAKLAVVTNKREALTNQLLEEIGCTHHFQAVVGGDSTAHPKPAADPALAALAALQVPPADALFVGDSQADVGCARAAGCAVVCVAYGYRQGVAAADLGADAIIETFLELI